MTDKHPFSTVAAAQARILRQAGSSSVLGENPFSLRESTDIENSPTDTADMPHEVNPNLHADLLRPNTERASVSPRPWQQQEKEKLTEAVRKGLPWNEIVGLLPGREYRSCVSEYYRLARPGEAHHIHVGSDIAEILQQETSGESVKPAQQNVQSRSSILDIAGNQGARDEGRAVGSHESRILLSKGQARMCIELPVALRSARDHPLFQSQGPGAEDFSCFATTLADLRVCLRVKSEAKGVKMPPARVLICLSLNDYNSKIRGSVGEAVTFCDAVYRSVPLTLPLSVGKFRWDWQYSTGDMVYFHKETWSREQQQQYRHQGAHQRFVLSSAATEWLWQSDNAVVLAILPLFADLTRQTTDGSEYLAEFDIANHYLLKTAKGCKDGPVIMICLPAQVIITCVHDLRACVGGTKTGGVCEQKRSKRAPKTSKIRWTFVPSSAAFKAWSGGKTIDIDASLASSVLQRLMSIYDAACRGEEAGVTLERWTEVRGLLFQGA